MTLPAWTMRLWWLACGLAVGYSASPHARATAAFLCFGIGALVLFVQLVRMRRAS